SSLKVVGIVKFMYSSEPSGERVYSSGMLSTMSGLPILQSSLKLGCGGRSRGLPSGAPASTHDTIVSMSFWVSWVELENLPNSGSAVHGGMSRLITFSRIDRAHGLASL